jgi:hypothetical protein
MRMAIKACLGLAVLACGLMVVAQADEKKEGKKEKLTGTMVCGKCKLKICDECTNVLQVKKGDKTVNYFIDDEGRKEKYHKAICPAKSQKAEITGIVSKKDDKMWIKPSKDGVKIIK